MSDYFDSDQQFGSISAELMARHSGMELLQDMIDGNLPAPTMAQTLNFKLVEIADGVAVFKGKALDTHYNPLGSVHGGWAGAVMDSALGCAVHTKMLAGMGYSTVEFKVHLVRPIFAHTGEVICEGRVVHFGRTIATSEATLKTIDGKLLAHGTETCAIFKLKP